MTKAPAERWSEGKLVAVMNLDRFRHWKCLRDSEGQNVKPESSIFAIVQDAIHTQECTTNRNFDATRFTPPHYSCDFCRIFDITH